MSGTTGTTKVAQDISRRASDLNKYVFLYFILLFLISIKLLYTRASDVVDVVKGRGLISPLNSQEVSRNLPRP